MNKSLNGGEVMKGMLSMLVGLMFLGSHLAAAADKVTLHPVKHHKKTTKVLNKAQETAAMSSIATDGQPLKAPNKTGISAQEKEEISETSMDGQPLKVPKKTSISAQEKEEISETAMDGQPHKVPNTTSNSIQEKEELSETAMDGPNTTKK